MKSLTVSISDLIIETGRKCDRYKRENNEEQYLFTVGQLRGIMDIADMIGVNYPKDLYYNLHITPVEEMLNGK